MAFRYISKWYHKRWYSLECCTSWIVTGTQMFTLPIHTCLLVHTLGPYTWSLQNFSGEENNNNNNNTIEDKCHGTFYFGIFQAGLGSAAVFITMKQLKPISAALTCFRSST